MRSESSPEPAFHAINEWQNSSHVVVQVLDSTRLDGIAFTLFGPVMTVDLHFFTVLRVLWDKELSFNQRI